MKITAHLTLISIICISVLACKSKKGTPPAASDTGQNTNSNSASIQAATHEKNESRFVVSFYSKGEGIDGKVNDEFVNFLNGYSKKIAYTPIRRGREGEINYCLPLNELSASEQTDFIKKANVILGKSQLVRIQENVECGQPKSAVSNPATIEDTHRLVVSFYSIGEGTDLKTKEEFDKFLSSYPKKIHFETIRWGREGEVDYCLKISELSSNEQADFVKKARELLGKSKLVRVNENASCVNKH